MNPNQNPKHFGVVRVRVRVIAISNLEMLLEYNEQISVPVGTSN